MPGGRIEVIGIPGLPEFVPGLDLGGHFYEAARRAGVPIRPLDVIVVAQKAVSKVEGRTVNLAEIVPGREAHQLALECEKDPRMVQAVLGEARRIVRAVRGVLIVETHHGFICANGGIDASNVPGTDIVTLLPVDPDASARRIRLSIELKVGGHVAVVVSDTFNRPWREGSINVAIGVSGMRPLLDQRGQEDDFGRILRVTIVSLADEICSAAQLVMGEVKGTPAVIIRGVEYSPGEEGATTLLRPAARDLFR